MNISQSLNSSFSKSLASLKTRKGILYIVIFVFALLAFEVFNFSTTDFALSDLLGRCPLGDIADNCLLRNRFCWYCAVICPAIWRGGTALSVVPFWCLDPGRNDECHPDLVGGGYGHAKPLGSECWYSGCKFCNEGCTDFHRPDGMGDPHFPDWYIIKKRGSFLKERNDPQTRTMSRREYRQAQSRAAQAAKAVRSVPAGFMTSRSSKPTTNRRGYRPEPQYIPMKDEAVYRSLKASKPGQRRS